jgi:hypothetical protein
MPSDPLSTLTHSGNAQPDMESTPREVQQRKLYSMHGPRSAEREELGYRRSAAAVELGNLMSSLVQRAGCHKRSS